MAAGQASGRVKRTGRASRVKRAGRKSRTVRVGSWRQAGRSWLRGRASSFTRRRTPAPTSTRGTGLFSLVYQALKDAQAQILGPDADAINSIAHFCEYALFGAL